MDLFILMKDTNDTTIIKPAEPEGGCPRCDGAVFQAEEVNIKGRVYHKKCLSCKQCKRPTDISLIAVGRYLFSCTTTIVKQKIFKKA